MIRIEERLISLETNHTQYLMYADDCGHLTHLYYGLPLSLQGDALRALTPRDVDPIGCSILSDPGSSVGCLDDALLEASFRGKGDMREPFAEIIHEDGSRTSDFRYEKAELSFGKLSPDGLPGAYSDDDTAPMSVTVTMKDRNSALVLELVYSVFEDCDCITRFARLRNDGDRPVRIERLMSLQLDLDRHAARAIGFRGDWARELQLYDTLVQGGKWVHGSSTGFSSNRANTFFMVCTPEATETAGECYGFNLLWSGSHRECVEINGRGLMRISSGIEPDQLSWLLVPGETFCAPEAVFTCSLTGYNGISSRMHAFIRRHIVRGFWRDRVRPILINSWEAMYFDVRERRLLKLADAAKDVGIELFVMDDGWFGKRNDDTSSLGDWTADPEKLPGGLEELSAKLKAKGLRFGIWVEPEMVSENSDLFRAHPDWAVRIPDMPHAIGRNQLLLDLTRPEVCDYIIESMTDVFTRGSVDYVKWDMNRNFSDMYSTALPADRQGEFAVRYILGLYHVLDTLTKRFPKVLFEGCASGGNRFDPGMLCYMPQIWASDCTDPITRIGIQNGYSYGYPQSVLGAHVSASPNHQTLRCTPLATRFTVAAAGVLGYECNLSDLKPKDLEAIRSQIAQYLQWREVLQFGSLRRLGGTIQNGTAAGPLDTELVRWMIVSPDRKRAAVLTVQGMTVPNHSRRVLRVPGLLPDRLYHLYNIPQTHDLRIMGDLINTQTPFHVRQDSALHTLIARVKRLDGEREDIIVSGSLLEHAGVRLAPRYAGTGFSEGTAIYQDLDSRIYYLEAVDEI